MLPSVGDSVREAQPYRANILASTMSYPYCELSRVLDQTPLLSPSHRMGRKSLSTSSVHETHCVWYSEWYRITERGVRLRCGRPLFV